MSKMSEVTSHLELKLIGLLDELIFELRFDLQKCIQST
jgi:hypothetical protein